MNPAYTVLRRPTTAARSLAAGQILSGAGLLACPGWVARLASGSTGAAPAAWVVRALGLRLLAQGVTLLARPTRGTEAASTAIDAAHGVSMLVVAVAGRRYRRAALVSASAATASATAAACLAVHRVQSG